MVGAFYMNGSKQLCGRQFRISQWVRRTALALFAGFTVVGFANSAESEVFVRETEYVLGVVAARLDAEQRRVALLNHAARVSTHPLANPPNLARALDGLSQRMNTDEDVLVVYLTWY